ncbi:MAG: hypothetical protein WKF94_00855 [Solirubrobacteraceae bacterium]
MTELATTTRRRLVAGALAVGAAGALPEAARARAPRRGRKVD